MAEKNPDIIMLALWSPSLPYPLLSAKWEEKLSGVEMGETRGENRGLRNEEAWTTARASEQQWRSSPPCLPSFSFPSMSHRHGSQSGHRKKQKRSFCTREPHEAGHLLRTCSIHWRLHLEDGKTLSILFSTSKLHWKVISFCIFVKP